MDNLRQKLSPHWFNLTFLAVLAGVPLLANWLHNPFIVHLATSAVIFGLAAVGLNLIMGFGGMVSLLHAGFFGIGGYGVAILAAQDFNGASFRLGPLAIPGTSNLLFSLPLAAGVAALAAALIGTVALRTSGAYFIMITLAFNQMLYFFFVSLQQFGGDDGLQILGTLTLGPISPDHKVAFYFVCLGILALALVCMQQLVASRFGMALRAIAQNEWRVSALGIAPMGIRLVAFTLSGAIAGLAGALMTAGEAFTSPGTMSWDRSGDLVVMCVLGGLTQVRGPVVGAIIFVVLQFVLSQWTSHWQLPFGLILIFIAAVVRGGSLGFLHRALIGKAAT